MVRRSHPWALLALLLVLVGAAPVAAGVDPAPIWRPRLLVAGVSDLELGSFGLGEGRTLTVLDGIILAAAAGLATQRIAEWSDGRVLPEVSVVEVPGPVESLRLLRSCGYIDAARGRSFLGPDRLAGADGVLLAWRPVPGRGTPPIPPCWGAVTTPARLQGFTSIQLLPAKGTAGTRIVHLAELLVHEWLHQVAFRLLARGMDTPPLDAGVVTYGYAPDASGSWAAWYRDVMTARVRAPDGTRLGIGDAGWRLAAMPVAPMR